MIIQKAEEQATVFFFFENKNKQQSHRNGSGSLRWPIRPTAHNRIFQPIKPATEPLERTAQLIDLHSCTCVRTCVVRTNFVRTYDELIDRCAAHESKRNGSLCGGRTTDRGIAHVRPVESIAALSDIASIDRPLVISDATILSC